MLQLREQAGREPATDRADWPARELLMSEPPTSPPDPPKFVECAICTGLIETLRETPELFSFDGGDRYGHRECIDERANCPACEHPLRGAIRHKVGVDPYESHYPDRYVECSSDNCPCTNFSMEG